MCRSWVLSARRGTSWWPQWSGGPFATLRLISSTRLQQIRWVRWCLSFVSKSGERESQRESLWLSLFLWLDLSFSEILPTLCRNDCQQKGWIIITCKNFPIGNPPTSFFLFLLQSAYHNICITLQMQMPHKFLLAAFNIGRIGMIWRICKDGKD